MNYSFSIITPEHSKSNIPYLVELYESIQKQTYVNWEWVIYLNGDCKLSDIPQEIKENEKVKLYIGISHENVGFIKNKAFNLGKGDILVEVDHDDLISEDCLEELNRAYQDENVGFVYSNEILYDMRGNHLPWNPANGWTHTVQSFRGGNYYSMDNFSPSSHSMSFIWYAPDHIRTWRKTVYQKLGGHNPELNICDDHDLIIRTYLNTEFKLVPKVLYYYRFLPDHNNTQIKRNELIQKKTVEIFQQYALDLAEHDANKRNLLKVDISSSYSRRDDYFCIREDYDLNNGIPLEDNSAFVILANDIVQKIKNPIQIMSEIHRVLCDGGWAFIQVPSTDGRGAFQDPTHVSYWNQNSFWYYTRSDKAKYIQNENIKFQEYRLDTIWYDDHVAMTNAWLCALKSDTRRPHLILI